MVGEGRLAHRSSLSAGSSTAALTVPLLLFFAVFFATPLIVLLGMSFANAPGSGAYGIAQYIRFFSSDLSLGILWATIRLGVEVTIVCLVLGLPLSLAYCRAGNVVKSVILFVIVMPLITSVVVRTFAWIIILGRQGIINESLLALGIIGAPLTLLYSEGGLVATLAQVQLPLMVLPLIACLKRLDPALYESSSSLGANAWRTFWKLTVPLAMPGIIGGSILCFAAALTAFVAQSLIGGGRKLYMPMYIFQQAVALNDWPYAAAASVILLGTVLICTVVFNRLGRLVHARY
jgi:putative spermidine/putrescine transport system permease protein